MLSHGDQRAAAARGSQAGGVGPVKRCVRRRRGARLWVAALCTASAVVSAGEITLGVAWQAAQQHDPVFAAAQAQWEAGQAQAEQARALWLPSVAASGSVGRGTQQSAMRGAMFAAPGFGSTSGVDFQTSITGGTATRWAVTAEQALVDSSRLASARQLRAGARTADEQYRAARQELILRTARGLFGVLDARAQLEALERLRAAAERTRAAAQARYDAGDIPVTDMREAQAMADAIGVQQLDARNALSLVEAAFHDLTGLDAAGIADLPPSAGSDARPPESLDAWSRRALAGSPELAIQRLAQQRAAAEVGRYARLLAPRVSVVAQAGRESLRGDGDFGAANLTGRQASVALQASVPLFTGGLRSAQRHEARALARRAGAELDSATLHVAQGTRAAWLGLGAAAERVQALQRLQDSARTRLEATRLGVENGGRTTLDLLDAEGDYQRTVADLRRAQTRWLLAGLELAAVAGELDAEGVRAVDGYLLSGP
ncbi:MAG: TolC family protein [Gammaproteobacteria bacterium]|nr:TolC family protein [Gammaproteobacteria bacterium]